jgi:hypothetical protein
MGTLHSLRALDINIYVSRIVVNSSIYVSGPKYFQLVARHKRYMRDGLDEDSYEMDLCIVTPDFPKETKCIPICMPGSSFMHIVTYK